MITRNEYIDIVGEEPINDDLERVNCEFAGLDGHASCGWCDCLDRPVFMGRCSKSQYMGNCLDGPLND